jgi:hypothetical protein
MATGYAAGPLPWAFEDGLAANAQLVKLDAGTDPESVSGRPPLSAGLRMALRRFTRLTNGFTKQFPSVGLAADAK